MIDIPLTISTLQQNGGEIEPITAAQLAAFGNALPNADIESFLNECLVTDLVQVGELRFHNYERIEAEVAPGARPGPTVYRLGHLPIASAIGGQLICVSQKDSKIRWADSSYICDEYLCSFDEGTLNELPVTTNNLIQIMPEVADDLQHLFHLIDSGDLDQIIDDLDSW